MLRQKINLLLSILFLLFLSFPELKISAEIITPDHEKINDHQQKLNRLQKGLHQHRKSIRKTRNKEINLLSELESINSKLRLEKQKLDKYRLEVKQQEKLIHRKQKEHKEKTVEKKKAKEHLKKRLAAYYQTGDIGIINVIFSARTLGDLLTYQEYFSKLLEHDRVILEDYKQTLLDLEQIQVSLKKNRDHFLKLSSLAREQTKKLKKVKEKRLALLDRVKTEKKLYQQALSEMSEASSKLAGKLVQLRRKLNRDKEEQKNKENTDKNIPEDKHSTQQKKDLPFKEMKGRLNPPVSGVVATSFGKNKDKRFGISTYAKGIDIKAKPGLNISAVYHGKVVYSGPLKGYGNLLIIDHGQQYYTLVSQVAKFIKHEGEMVRRGDIIATTGEQTGLIQEGIHFEIRHGTKPEDPLKWLNNGKIIVKKVKRK
jgi:murein hydrolase activator